MNEAGETLGRQTAQRYSLEGFRPPWPIAIIQGVMFVFGALSIVGLWYALINFPTGSVNGQGIFDIGIFLFGLSVAIFLVLGLGRGAIACSWTEGRFVLHYRYLGDRVFDWGSPRFRRKLTRIVQPTVTQYQLNTRFPFVNRIPPDLYSVILREADLRGKQVKRKDTRAGKLEIEEIVISTPG